MSDRAELLAHVTGERARAAAAMAELAGDASACAMGRAGRSFPAYKYHEGATAALGALSRKLRRDTGTAPGELLGAVTSEWQTPAGPGRDWEAYTAGGREALEAVADYISRGS